MLPVRKAAWLPPKRHFERGFGVMHQLYVTQANKGCDFDFLEEPVPASPENALAMHWLASRLPIDRRDPAKMLR